MAENFYDLTVGFCRLDITPPLGVNLLGYYEERIADGILDNLEVNTIAVEKNGNTAVILAVDNIGIRTDFLNVVREKISLKTGLPQSAIYIHSTHTHTGPMLNAEKNLEKQIEIDYARIAYDKFTDAAILAIQDLKPAKMGYAVTKAEGIGFNRRYLMKDGSICTNPGVNNPDVDKCIGLTDDEVIVLRFNRQDGNNIVIANYSNHADTVGGTKISADWVGQTRRIFEKTIDNTRCIVLNGTEGDINHINVRPKKGEFNGLKIDFDSVPRGYEHAVHMGNVLAGAIMQVYAKVNYVEIDNIGYATKMVEVPSNMPSQEDLERTKYVYEMHQAGRDSELPYKGMQLTTFVAEAARVYNLKDGPKFMPMIVSALNIGKIAMVGFAGEPFVGVGLEMKKTEGWDLVVPCCLVNGKEGYFPMQSSYDEGGYEAKCSLFKAGVAELLIKEGKKLLDELKK